jgi:hypothetical protein
MLTRVILHVNPESNKNNVFLAYSVANMAGMVEEIIMTTLVVHVAYAITCGTATIIICAMCKRAQDLAILLVTYTTELTYGHNVVRIQIHKTMADLSKGVDSTKNNIAETTTTTTTTVNLITMFLVTRNIISSRIKTIKQIQTWLQTTSCPYKNPGNSGRTQGDHGNGTWNIKQQNAPNAYYMQKGTADRIYYGGSKLIEAPIQAIVSEAR